MDTTGLIHRFLKEKACQSVGRPDDLRWEDKVVAVLEARDGTIPNAARIIKALVSDKD